MVLLLRRGKTATIGIDRVDHDGTGREDIARGISGIDSVSRVARFSGALCVTSVRRCVAPATRGATLPRGFIPVPREMRFALIRAKGCAEQGEHDVGDVAPI